MDLKVLKYSSILLSTALFVSTPLAAANLSQPQEAEFRSTRTLPQSKEEALELTRSAVEVIGVQSVDQSSGRVVSKYYRHRVGPSTFRTRVTAVVTRRAEGTIVEVRAQRELLMESLHTGVFQGGPRWQSVGSHDAVLADIIERIEKAAGVWMDPEEEALRNAAQEAVQAAGGVAPAPVSGTRWSEIASLKTERRDLLAPIRALDEAALQIVYAGNLEERQAELQRIRDERNRLWEETRPRIMEIDKRILELVLAD